MKPETVIRLYRDEDRTEVMRIAADTAFFGAPVEAFFEHRQTFLDGFYAYFLDCESSTCWVAQKDNVVIGFLVGSQHADRQSGYSLIHIYPNMLTGLFRGKYRLGPKTMRYMFTLVGEAIRGEFPVADLNEYPANLHINVSSQARGMGIGKSLMNAYHRQLKSLGVSGVHLHTTDQNVAACAMYEHLGYQLLGARKTRAWFPLLGQIVENRCYGLKLN